MTTPLQNGVGQGHGQTNGPKLGTLLTKLNVHAGDAKIVITISKSDDVIEVNIDRMEPELLDVGSNLGEARVLKQQHAQLLHNVQTKQQEVVDMLAQQQQQHLMTSFVESWKNMLKEFEMRGSLIEQSIAFHESAIQFSRKMEQAQDSFSHVGVPRDVTDAQKLLQQHQDLKKSVLESSMSTLQEGQLLLDRIQDLSLRSSHIHHQNHATTAACYGIERLLEMMQDRRRRLEELWSLRKLKLETNLQKVLLEAEIQQISDWFDKVGDPYLEKKELGDSLPSSQRLQDVHVKFEHEAKEIETTLLKLSKTSDHLVHCGNPDTGVSFDDVTRKVKSLEVICEKFFQSLDGRRKELASARNFFALAQTALSKLDEVEVQVLSTDPTLTLKSLADRHAYLSSCIMETCTPPIQEGRRLVERVTRGHPGVKGVVALMESLEERSKKLSELCRAKGQASEQDQVKHKFNEKFSLLHSWLYRIIETSIQQHQNMGGNYSAGRDFLDLHERLLEDMKNKRESLNELVTSSNVVGEAATDRSKKLVERWNELHSFIQERVRLSQAYVAFHKKAQQLAIQMDILEEYLKIDKVDPTRVTDSTLHYKEQSVNQLNTELTDVESRGKNFIKIVSEVKVDEKLDTKHAIVVVENLLQHFTERKYLITEYHQHWKVHVHSNKEFKGQWTKFMQEARNALEWVAKEEKDFFAPYIAGYLGRNLNEVTQLEAKLELFRPTAKKAYETIEKLLKEAEILASKGETNGQRDQITTELLRVHTRFQARLNEYKTLLAMAHKFFEHLEQLDKMLEQTEHEYSSKQLPSNLTNAQLLLAEHRSNRDKLKHLIGQTLNEGEEIVMRVRQQDAETIASEEIQKVLLMADERRRSWESTWEKQRNRLEHNLHMCQFYFDLRQLHNELDELHRILKSRHGNYGTSTSSVKMISQAYQLFEKSAQMIEGKVKNFSNTADLMVKDGRYDSRRIKREVEEVERKWTDFHNSISEYRKNIDESLKFFQDMELCEGWINGASQFLMNIGQRANECTSSDDVIKLIGELVKFKDEGTLQQNERLDRMENIATDLYGNVTGPHKMQHVVDSNQEMINNIIKAIEELSILRDNLSKKEAILAQMELVVEKKAPRQPRFVQPLQNAEIVEGNRFTFECRLECDTKTPRIEWFKDESPVTINDALATEFKDGLCQLRFAHTSIKDSSTYKCKVFTEAGEAETSASLKVKEAQHKVIPPTFVVPLHCLELPEGTSAILEVQITGLPVPTVTWFKDDKPLDGTGGDDFVVSRLDGTYTVKIRKLQKEVHSGRYLCKATNQGGEAESVANVKVVSVQKPVFTEPLKDQHVKEGTRVTLSIRFSGEPAPQIKWLRNDGQIIPSSSFKIIVEHGYSALEIKEFFPEDSGLYTVVARNLGGETRTSCHLDIEGLTFHPGVRGPQAPSKPRFIDFLQNKDVQEGSRAHFKCHVVGYPTPQISWYRDDKQLKDTKDFQLGFDGERCTLIIKEVYLEDAGEYRCVATNEHGSDMTTCRLQVESLSELSDASSTLLTDLVPPKFTQLLKDIEGTEGELIRFDCCVIGNPQPIVKWYRGRNQIQPSTDFQITTTDRDKHSLTIPEVFKEDAGNYVVRATNAAGAAKCYASLIIKQTSDSHLMKTRLVEASHSSSQKMSLLPGQSAPEFIKLFGDTRVKPGQPCDLVVIVVGNPVPKVRWLFNNEPISSTAPYHIRVGPSGQHILHIPEVHVVDAGRYSIIADNEVGQATCSALLVVVEDTMLPHTGDSPPETPMKLPQKQPPTLMKITQTTKLAQISPVPSPTFLSHLQKPALLKPVDLVIPLPVAPEFTVPLKNLNVEEGTEVTFEVHVSGKPEPEITWYKNGVEVKPDKDHAIIRKEGLVQLIIRHATNSDTGRFVCVAKNDGGQVQSSAQLTVKAPQEPPRFLERLQTTSVREGDTVKFVVKVTGKPEPEVTWYRQGQKIVNTKDFQISKIGDVHTLLIPEVFGEDQGKFTVKVTNSAGQSQCTADLIVQVSSKEESVTPPPPITSVPKKFVQPIRSEPSPPKKLHFLKPLSDVKAVEGKPVTLECVIPPFPNPDKVQWFRNEIEIFSCPDYEITFTLGVCRLTIPQVYKEDSGHYSCTVSISGWPTTTSMCLIVEAPEPAYKPLERAPSFVRPLTNQILRRGGTAYFECKVDGWPPAEILWTRKGHPLVDKNRYKSTYDQNNGVTTLTIYDLRDEDEGEYSCKAINHLGNDVTSATLHSPDVTSGRKSGTPKSPIFPGHKPFKPEPEEPFKVPSYEKRLKQETDYRTQQAPQPQPAKPPSPGVDETSNISPEALRRLGISPTKLGPNEKGGVAEQYFKPHFRKIPHDVIVPEGHMARFDCVVHGRPTPDVTWYRNGVKVNEDRLHKIVINEAGVNSLIFDSVSKHDAGNYTCIATNAAGSDQFNVSLNVDALPYPHPPEFLEPLKDQLIQEGNPVSFSTDASGFPHPQYIWQKDGRALDSYKESSRYNVEQNGSRTTLSISSCRPEDSATYQCTAFNQSGAQVQRVRLIVQPSPKQQVPDSLPTQPKRTILTATKPSHQSPVRPPSEPTFPYQPVVDHTPSPSHFSRAEFTLTPTPTKQQQTLPWERTDGAADDKFNRDIPKPPKFIQPIKSLLNLTENQPAKFECKLVPLGDPDMKVEWFKDGVLLKHGHRFRESNEFGKVVLHILYTYPEDNGTYLCRAVNKWGSDTTHAQLHCTGKESVIYTSQITDEIDGLHHIPYPHADDVTNQTPPSFEQLPTKVTIDEGETARFQVKVNGNPRPKVTWYINGNEAVNNQRFNLTYDGTTHAVEITKARDYDSGEVKVVARNQVDVVEAVTSLKVVAKDDWKSKPYGTTQVQFQPTENGPTTFQPDINTRHSFIDSTVHISKTTTTAIFEQPKVGQTEVSRKLFQKTQPIKKETPVFTKPLQNVVAKEGTVVKFEVCFTGIPTPEIKWYRDDVEIQPSRDFQISQSYQSSQLLIPEVFPEDAGSYSVRALSDTGFAECRALLKVEDDLEKVKDSAPEVKTYLQDISVNAGEPVAFDCKIVGQPKPHVTWFKDGHKLQDSPRYKTVSDEEGHETFLIYHTSPADGGQYVCEATNKLGKRTTSAKLTVKGEPKFVKAPSPPSSHTTPKLVQPLHDVTVNEGEPIQLKCVIVSEPYPVVTWYHDGQPIKPSKYFTMISGPDGSHVLKMAAVFPEDEGSYKCVARNARGQMETSCKLNIRSHPHYSSANQQQEQVVTQMSYIEMTPPQFLKPIYEMDVVKGGQAIFEVILTGSPAPDVIWFHEGQQIFHGPDFQILQNNDKHWLIMKQVQPEDSGVFTCRATNPAGVAECSAKLNVIDDTRVSSATLDIFHPTQESVPRRPPTIVKGLPPTVVGTVGCVVKLEVHVDSNPAPNFQWTTKNRPIQPSTKHNISYDNGVIVLLLTNLQPIDGGDYLLRVYNELGDAVCKTTIVVQQANQAPVQPPVAPPITSLSMPPVFVVTLKPETKVSERTVARLECKVKANPPADVTWHVNGVPLPPSYKFIQTVLGDRNVLEIRDVSIRDSAVYTCKASSSAGEAITSTTLIVLSAEPRPVAPHFVRHLENAVGTDGREVALTCVVKGQPFPEITWYHNHKCIDKCEDFVINCDRESGKIELVIVDCLPDDQGKFRCIATNQAGQAISECNLTVRSTQPPPTKPDEVTTLDKDITVIKKIVKRTSGQPPRFTQPIQPCIVRPGETCQFLAKVSGVPQPEIVWLKDKVDLPLTFRHAPSFDPATGSCVLKISDVRPEDVGVYSCRASNLAGKATCTANVVVVPPDAEVTITEKTVSVKKEKVTVVGDQETRVVENSPAFVENLFPLTEAYEGETVKFACKVIAEPEPMLTWLFNGREITNSPRTTLTFDRSTTTLTLHDVSPRDAGEYVCKASNNLGEASTKTFLRIKKDQPVSTVQFQSIESIQTDQRAHPPTTTTIFPYQQRPQQQQDVPTLNLEPITDKDPPKFTLPLRNQSSFDSEQVVFRVMFQGQPMPSVTWYFNNQPIHPSQDFKINVDKTRGESTLVIVEVFPEDEGDYTCKAENEFGTAVTHCHLFVKLPSSLSPSGDEIDYTAPHITLNQTTEVIKTLAQSPLQQLAPIKDARRFSETIAVDHKERLKEMAMQFELPKPVIQKSELLVRRESVPVGMKMEVDVEPPPVMTQEKLIELKKRIEATCTERQQLLIPLIKHQRRFSETLAVELRKKPQEMVFQIDLPIKPEKSQVVVMQKSAPKPVRLEVEVEERPTVPDVTEMSAIEIVKTKRVQAMETQRQEFKMAVIETGTPPIFLWQLQSQKVMDGDEVRFTCKVKANPMPDVTWYHNGKVVLDNPDFRTSYNRDTGDVVLFIIEVFPQDTGIYECVAVNKYGSATTRAQLIVEVYEYIPDSEEATASQTESIFSSSSMDDSDFQSRTRKFLENMEKLKKEVHEDDVNRKFEEMVVEEFDVGERGYEETILMADVKWQVQKRISLEKEEVPVEITSQTTFEIPLVKPIKKEVTLTRDISVASGSPIQSRVAPQITPHHLFTTQELVKTTQETRARVAPIEPEPPTVLMIEKTTTTTTTQQGDIVTTETTTTGRKEIVSEERAQEWRSEQEGGEVKEHFTAFEVIEEPKKECLAPFFVNKLQAKEVLVGSKVVLECEVFGIPVPEISWYKNGVPLTSSEHVTQSRCDDNKCQLTFACVTPEDQGEYMCRAQNQHGLATTWAEMIVESKIEDLLLTSSSTSSSSASTKMVAVQSIGEKKSLGGKMAPPSSKLIFVSSSHPTSSSTSSNVMATENAATLSFFGELAPSIPSGK